MKKLFVLILCVISVFSCFSCSAPQNKRETEKTVENVEKDSVNIDEPSTDKDSTESTTEEYDYVDPRDDGGWTPWHLDSDN